MPGAPAAPDPPSTDRLRSPSPFAGGGWGGGTSKEPGALRHRPSPPHPGFAHPLPRGRGRGSEVITFVGTLPGRTNSRNEAISFSTSPFKITLFFSTTRRTGALRPPPASRKRPVLGPKGAFSTPSAWHSQPPPGTACSATEDDQPERSRRFAERSHFDIRNPNRPFHFGPFSPGAPGRTDRHPHASHTSSTGIGSPDAGVWRSAVVGSGRPGRAGRPDGAAGLPPGGIPVAGVPASLAEPVEETARPGHPSPIDFPRRFS